ncbi:hypothetical protein [Enterovibrio paralichthyis]|uniref:hypothetical protein n=1 Tax=Enterovibrio paralichthyis TaxID=2853805 RepID=UPI001C4648B8|nr:hypothetical protein [Enterovibrio paralichthyis]MBV7300222.1 hypothetical protein [Enterovibrio paralichthyis]
MNAYTVKTILSSCLALLETQHRPTFLDAKSEQVKYLDLCFHTSVTGYRIIDNAIADCMRDAAQARCWAMYSDSLARAIHILTVFMVIRDNNPSMRNGTLSPEQHDQMIFNVIG